jgi:hypothetical protein
LWKSGIAKGLGLYYNLFSSSSAELAYQVRELETIESINLTLVLETVFRLKVRSFGKRPENWDGNVLEKTKAPGFTYYFL